MLCNDFSVGDLSKVEAVMSKEVKKRNSMETKEHHLLSIIRSIACRQFAGLFVDFHELPDSFILMKYDLFRVYDAALRQLRTQA